MFSHSAYGKLALLIRLNTVNKKEQNVQSAGCGKKTDDEGDSPSSSWHWKEGDEGDSPCHLSVFN